MQRLPADSSGSAPRRAAWAPVAALLGEAAWKLALLAVNLPAAAFGSHERQLDIAYGEDPQHRLDAYVPVEAGAEARPLVVFWHGGRWNSGDKAEYRFVGAALAESGYAAVLPNYRHYPQVLMPGFMEDAARAALWAAEHASDLGADPNRVYLMGHSSGAHLAALLTLDTRYFAATGRPAPRIAGVIGLSGPYDFLPLREPDVQEMFGPPEKYAQSQPINFVRPGVPPMLLIHGSNDGRVWPKNSVNLAAALRACGAAVTLKLYRERGHADTLAALSIPARRRAPTLADIAAFINPPRV
jgi:acetyl esterase/lipase